MWQSHTGKGYVDASTVDAETAQKVSQVQPSSLAWPCCMLWWGVKCAAAPSWAMPYLHRLPFISQHGALEAYVKGLAKCCCSHCRTSDCVQTWSWILSLSLSHCRMRASQIVKEAGGSYLEAPVSGSKQPAEQGTLIFLCGGDQALFEEAGPLLDVMGKAKLFLGNVRSTSLSGSAPCYGITQNCEDAQVTGHCGKVQVSRLMRSAVEH